MGIKFDQETNTFSVSYSKRHPITRQPVTRVRKGLKSKVEASRVHASLILVVNDLLKKRIVPTWEKVLDDYIENIRQSDLKKNTIYCRDKVLKAHTQVWNSRLIDEITTQNIHDLLKDRFKDKSESHAKFFVKGIRGVFQFALDSGHINRNPTPLLKFKINEKIKNVLNEEQIKILLRRSQELSWEWYPHYALAVYTGLRNGEMYALTWDKVNLELRQILVNCSWSNKDGYKSTKSGDDRIVEIPKPLLPLLAELKLKGSDGDFVLPRLQKWDKGEQARILRLFLQSIGLPLLRFHDLRASWATLLLGKGVAPSKVMAMGGWKDMDTMMIYMRKAGINIRDATSCLDDMQTHGVSIAKVVELPLS